MYNSNLARINSTLSSMNDLSNSVTNDNVKNKVNEFNKSANESIKKYSNLDFSISDNVKAIDNIYTPLLKDQDFITDFSSTSHLNNQMQVGFSKRDSDKKDERGEFSMTNLAYVSNGFYDLREAKNSKELKLAAGNARQRVYVPYVDVSKEIEDSLLASKAEVSYDKSVGGYIVTYHNGATGEKFSNSLEKYLDLTLSDKAKGQLRVESRVSVDNQIQSQGKEKVTTDYIQHSIEYNDRLIDKLTSHQKEITSKMSTLPKDMKKMSNKEKELYKLYNDSLESISTNIGSLNSRKEEFSKISKNIQDGTFNYDNILDRMVEDITDQKKNALTSGIAESYSDMTSKITLKEDTAYSHMQDLSLHYSELNLKKLEFNQKKLEHKDTVRLAEDRMKLDAMIAGLQYGENGKLSPGGATSAVLDFDGDLNAYNVSLLEHETSTAKQKVEANALYTKLYESEHDGKQPPSIDPKINPTGYKAEMKKREDFSSPTVVLGDEWSKAYKDAKNNVFKTTALERDNLEVKKEYYRKAIDAWNNLPENQDKKVNGEGELYIDNKGYIKSHVGDPSIFKKLYNGISSSPKAAFLGVASYLMGNSFTNSVGVANEVVTEKTKSATEQFNNWIKKPKDIGGYSEKLNFSVNNVLNESGSSAKLVYNENINGINTWVNSHPNNGTTIDELKKLNPTYTKEELNYAYQEFLHQRNIPKFNLSVKATTREKGTTFILPDAKVSDSDKDENKVSGINKVSSEGITLPVDNTYYVNPNLAAASLEHKENIKIGNFIFSNMPEKNPQKPYVVYPNEKGHHYFYESTNNGNYQIQQNKEGLYEFIPNTKPIELNSSEIKPLYNNGLHIFDDENNTRISLYENDDFREKLTNYIKENPKKFPKDKIMSVDQNTINSILNIK